MRELSQHIRVTPVQGSVTDPFDFMADRPFSLQLSCESDDGGTYWKCDKTVTVELPPAATQVFFRFRRSCVVDVWDNEGTQYRLGSDDMPARVLFTRYLNTAELRFECETDHDPLACPVAVLTRA